MSQAQVSAPPPARHSAPPRHGAPERRPSGRAVRVGSCLLLAGRADDVVRAARTLMPPEPRAMLVHVLRPRPLDTATTAPPSTPLSFLATDEIAPALPVGGAQVLLASAPLARTADHALAPMTALAQTPLVRASRALLFSLFSDLSATETAAGSAEEVIVSALRAVVHEHPSALPPSSRHAPLDVRLAALIDARHTDPRLDVDQIAHELHSSRRQLYRHTDSVGVAGMLTRRRIQTARDLLDRHPSLSITEVAQRSGFSSTARLRVQFLRSHGVTPAAYRQGLQADPADES